MEINTKRVGRMLLTGVGVFVAALIIYFGYLVKIGYYKIDIQTLWYDKVEIPGYSYFSGENHLDCSIRRTGLKIYGQQLFVNKEVNNPVCPL